MPTLSKVRILIRWSVSFKTTYVTGVTVKQYNLLYLIGLTLPHGSSKVCGFINETILVYIEKMLKISNLADYGCLLMITITQSNEQHYTAGMLAQRADLSIPVTKKVLRLLHNASLVSSKRGAQGGYTITREPSSITLLNIVEAIDGPITVTNCCDKEPICHRMENCDLKPHWLTVNTAVRDNLSSVTLKEMASRKHS